MNRSRESLAAPRRAARERLQERLEIITRCPVAIRTMESARLRESRLYWINGVLLLNSIILFLRPLTEQMNLTTFAECAAAQSLGNKTSPGRSAARGSQIRRFQVDLVPFRQVV